MVVETVFTTGGLGTKFVQGISNRDYPMIMGFVLIMGTIYVGVNLCSDVCLHILDPRTALGGGMDGGEV